MASKTREPSRCNAFSFVHNNQFYVCHGYENVLFGSLKSERKPHKSLIISRVSLQRFDFSSAQWSGEPPESGYETVKELEDRGYWTNVERSASVCCVVLGDCAYIFNWNHDPECVVHKLNLETRILQRVPQNTKDSPSLKNEMPLNWEMVACGDDALCVFVTTRKESRLHHSHLHLFHLQTG